jgi:hypothetical protein
MMELHLPLQALGKILIGAISHASNVVFKVTMQMSALISKSVMITTTEIVMDHQPIINPETSQAQQL